MKIHRRKWALWFGVILVFLLSGCQVGNTEVTFASELSDQEVFRIGDEICSLSEARVFLTNYQNLYGTAYGVNLWEHDFGDDSLEEYVKDLTISQLARIMSMDLLAKEQDISLNETELSKVDEAAKVYYASLSQDEIRYMDVDEGSIRRLYQQYGLADKLYQQLTAGVNDEVSDDEARVMEAYQIFVTDKADADAVANNLQSGVDFLTLAGSYNEAARTEITFGRGELPEAVEEAAFALMPEAVTDAIAAGDGWYFIKCINNYDQEMTDANKQVILERRRKEAFDDVYEAFVETLPSEFNEELWKNITLKADESIKTRNFFEIYEEYCKW